jgi:hypothetical protein
MMKTFPQNLSASWIEVENLDKCRRIDAVTDDQGTYNEPAEYYTTGFITYQPNFFTLFLYSIVRRLANNKIKKIWALSASYRNAPNWFKEEYEGKTCTKISWVCFKAGYQLLLTLYCLD